MREDRRQGRDRDRRPPGRPAHGGPTGPGRPHPHGRPPGAKPPPPPAAAAERTDWDHVATWYDRLVGDEGSDYHRHVVLPAAMRLLNARADEKVLDLCCGQGVFCRLLAQHGVRQIVGVDASPALIAAARQRGPAHVRYVVGDARALGGLADASFDAAACLMAVHDLDDLGPAMASLAAALKPGGRAVLIFMHPCFRIPRQSSWGWDDQKRTQFRRLDRYATPMAIPISTHPGKAPSEHTAFFHRPLADYLNALGQAGLGVVGCEELLSHRVSQPGGHSRGENRSRQEFPVFLALQAIKRG